MKPSWMSNKESIGASELQELQRIQGRMLTQNNRATSYPLHDKQRSPCA